MSARANVESRHPLIFKKNLRAKLFQHREFLREAKHHVSFLIRFLATTSSKSVLFLLFSIDNIF